MSPALADLATQVTAGVGRLGQRDELRVKITSLDAVDKATDLLREQLKSLADSMDAVHEAGVVLPTPDGTSVLKGLKALAAQLGGGDVDREFAQSTIDATGSLLRSAREIVGQAWRSHVSERVPPPTDLLVLADAFMAVPGAGAEPARLKAAIRAIDDLVRKPPTKEAVEELDALAETIPRLLADMVGDWPDVRVFVDQLAKGGAGIQFLTSQVVDWMHQKGFENSFKIVAGRPARPQS